MDQAHQPGHGEPVGERLCRNARRCEACPLKQKCCPKAPSRRFPRDIYEDARDLARSLVGTPEFEQSRRERKKVEMVFAHLKKIFRLSRLRLRGPRGAQDEFVLAATAQNLKKLAKHITRSLRWFSPVRCVSIKMEFKCMKDHIQEPPNRPNTFRKNQGEILVSMISANSYLSSQGSRLLQQYRHIADSFGVSSIRPLLGAKQN